MNDSTFALTETQRIKLRERYPISYHPKFHSFHILHFEAFSKNVGLTFIAKINNLEAWEKASVIASGPAIKCSDKNEWIVPFKAFRSQIAAILEQPDLVWVSLAEIKERHGGGLFFILQIA